jgi:hypothetical protein
VSNTAGVLHPRSIPTYTVTIAPIFQTAVINDVRLLRRRQHQDDTEVGNLVETVGSGGPVQTQSSTVSSTITTEQITNLPRRLPQRAELRRFLPASKRRPRGSTISGLPQNTISVTYDGST